MSGERVALNTQLAGHSPTVPAEALASVSTPIFQTATFNVAQQTAFDYTRSGNPTRHALEGLVAKADRAHASFAFTSGMAALTAMVRLLRPGDGVLAATDLYGGMHRLLSNCGVHSGLDVAFVPTWEVEAVRAAFAERPHTRMLCVESPTNPLMRVSNLRALARVAHEHGALMCVDNSVMSPVLATPLDLGQDCSADVVMHSATKFFGGHSDVTAGTLSVRDPELAKRLAMVQNAEGAGLAPFDAWLVLRGMRTMGLRVAAAQANAQELAAVLETHPAVTAVHYLSPERSDDEARVHFGQARGGGSVLSFETGDVAVSRAFVDAATQRGGLFKKTVSFGSTSSLVELPAEMSHASVPAAERGAPDDLVRMSVGIEDVDDLARALRRALSIAQATGAPAEAHGLPPGLRSGGEGRAATDGALPFGVSLPLRDQHAVGVSMPRWADVVAYEEGCPEAHARMVSGYPRFVFLEPVKRMHAAATRLFAVPGEAAMVLPSARVALRLQRFLGAAGVSTVQVHDLFAHGAFAVTYPAEHAAEAKLFWQHCGEIVSSRLAEAVVDVLDRTCWENSRRLVDEDTDGADEAVVDVLDARVGGEEGRTRRTASDPHGALVSRVASLYGVDRSNAYLYPTGMAAIAAAHRLLKLSSDWDAVPLRNVVFGFPYLDTLKLNARPELGSGVVFYGNGDSADVQSLRALLAGGERIGGLFCEFPSNPLLRAPPLAELRALADEHGFPLVVDDSVVGVCNVELLGPRGADIVVSSLTKQFSGANNAMGGALVLNPETRLSARLHARLDRDYERLLWRDDAAQLLKASADLEVRAAASNAAANALVRMLEAEPAVRQVYHPLISTPALYEQYRRESGGHGGMLSLLVGHDADAKRLYDALDVPKGPGFGSNFSLVCPYTMIAHFNELEWASDFGVDRSLLRVWVGSAESPEQLCEGFRGAIRSLGDD